MLSEIIIFEMNLKNSKANRTENRIHSKIEIDTLEHWRADKTDLTV
jgi:hypothetical protein